MYIMAYLILQLSMHVKSNIKYAIQKWALSTFNVLKY